MRWDIHRTPEPTTLALARSSQVVPTKRPSGFNIRATCQIIFSKAELKIIDKWIVGNDPTLDRKEGIRRLVELGLKSKK